MRCGDQEEMLIERVSALYEAIAGLPSLSPSEEVNSLFTELVLACLPPSPIDVSRLRPKAQEMRSHLIELCAKAEGLLESHYSDALAAHDNPLHHLTLFPYYSNYLQLSRLEHTLLARHVAGPASRVAFVGSGPLPLSSIVLATRHMRAARFCNYDLDPAANARARKLVAGDPDLRARMEFVEADVMDVAHAQLAGFDVVFLAALVGIGREEKARVLGHLARCMAPGAALVVRSAHGARAFLYPVVEPGDLKGFEVLAVHHPAGEVVNSVILARKLPPGAGLGSVVMRPCKCCEMMQGLSHLGHVGMMEEVALEELPS